MDNNYCNIICLQDFCSATLMSCVRDLILVLQPYQSAALEMVLATPLVVCAIIALVC